MTSPLALREPTSDQRPPLNQKYLAVRGQSPAQSLYSFVGETTVHFVSFFCDTTHQRAQLTSIRIQPLSASHSRGNQAINQRNLFDQTTRSGIGVHRRSHNNMSKVRLTPNSVVGTAERQTYDEGARQYESVIWYQLPFAKRIPFRLTHVTRRTGRFQTQSRGHGSHSVKKFRGQKKEESRVGAKRKPHNF